MFKSLYQLQSAIAHGGPARIWSVWKDRKFSGYSFRSLSYSWPKNLILFNHSDRSTRTHFFLPHLESSATYGGIATALKLAWDLVRKGKAVHFVLCDGGGQLDTIQRVLKISEEEWKSQSSLMSLDSYAYQNEILLEVHPDDEFWATAWWTKKTLDNAKTPKGAFAQLSAEAVTYLVQDYEPLFYLETDSVEKQLKTLARSSYEKSSNVVVNSQFLADFLVEKKIYDPHQLVSWKVFDPWIDESLYYSDASIKKKKQVFVYARPEVHRNRFDKVLEILRKVAPDVAPDWKWYGLGTLRERVKISEDSEIYLEGRGKLSAKEYADFLRETPVGLCLMESPHPSYPPLELEKCGGVVICNHYANKDYSQLSKNFISCDLETEKLAEALKNILLDFQTRAYPKVE